MTIVFSEDFNEYCSNKPSMPNDAVRLKKNKYFSIEISDGESYFLYELFPCENSTSFAIQFSLKDEIFYVHKIDRTDI